MPGNVSEVLDESQDAELSFRGADVAIVTARGKPNFVGTLRNKTIETENDDDEDEDAVPSTSFQ